MKPLLLVLHLRLYKESDTSLNFDKLLFSLLKKYLRTHNKTILLYCDNKNGVFIIYMSNINRFTYMKLFNELFFKIKSKRQR